MPTARRARIFLLATLLLISLAGELFARRAVVYRKDGNPLEGEVIKDDAGGVTIMIAGIETPIPRDQIDRVEYKASVAEQYQQRRKAIADDNVIDRLALADWLVEQQAYELAKSELADLPKHSPNEDQKRKINLLNRYIDEQLKLAANSSAAAAGTVSAGKSASRPSGQKEEDSKLLNDDQVNWIRIMEVDEVREKPPVTIPREVIDQFLRDYSDVDGVPRGREDQVKFRNLKGWQQLHVIFEADAKPLYDKIKIEKDPQLIQDFRKDVYKPYVMTYCGAPTCHGSDKTGEMFLFRKRMDDTATLYTNYYILHSWNDDRGYVLDFFKPESSYLLQYGLPQDAAAYRHPEVPGWKPAFRNRDDARYRTVYNWINSFGGTRRKYPFQYTPPKFKKAGTPATQPDAAKSSTPGQRSSTPSPKK
ncbi:MAG: hypothetical protein IT444_07100 [Phycisphaeraceae bacterium]|nr:hypothetical protein [Phycisphaeraceae bacterium]